MEGHQGFEEVYQAVTTLNSYATLAEFKAYLTSRSGDSPPADASADTVLEGFLKSASRYLDTQSGRRFNPYIETRYFSVPSIDDVDPRLLKLDDDLLEVISVTNGDGTVIPSTEYSLRPRNTSPKAAVRLIDNSTYYWASDGAGDTHDVIAVYGVWGCHNRYSQAWLLGTTAAEAMDATETGYDVTDGTPFVSGNLIRFDNELGFVVSKSSNTLTITRGENYSTAATHLTGINVYIWQAMDEAKQAVLEIANQARNRRFGSSTSNTVTVTGAGVVLSPRDIPVMAHDFISTFRKYT